MYLITLILQEVIDDSIITSHFQPIMVEMNSQEILPKTTTIRSVDTITKVRPIKRTLKSLILVQLTDCDKG